MATSSVFVLTVLSVFLYQHMRASFQERGLAKEPITVFQTELRILPNRHVAVFERFIGRAGGNRIKRGLIRVIFPEFADSIGGEHISDIEEVYAALDDKPILLSHFDKTHALSVNLSRPEPLSPGDHSFQLQYKLSNRVTMIGEQEELLFDITNVWTVLVNSVVVAVRFPEYIDAAAVKAEARIVNGPATEVVAGIASGAEDNTETRLQPDPDVEGAKMLVFRSRRPLKLGERFVIFLTWPPVLSNSSKS